MQTWSWALAPSPGLLHLTAVPITGPIAGAADTEHSPGASPRSGGRWTRGAGAVDGSVSCSGAWLMESPVVATGLLPQVSCCAGAISRQRGQGWCILSFKETCLKAEEERGQQRSEDVVLQPGGVRRLLSPAQRRIAAV